MNVNGYRNAQMTRSFDSPLGAQAGGYPGIGDPFAGGGGLFGPGPGAAGAASPGGGAPFFPQTQPNLPAVLPAPSAPAPAAKSGPSLPTLSDLKLLVERMGGIDGLLATMGKVQKVFGTFQQMAPMFKLLAGSFLKKGASVAKATELGEWRPRRRRSRGRRRRAAGGYRRASGRAGRRPRR